MNKIHTEDENKKYNIHFKFDLDSIVSYHHASLSNKDNCAHELLIA